MPTKHEHTHCELRVCSFTPLVTGNSKGGLYVKYYALGKKHEVECRSSLAEWNDLVKRGRIREANTKNATARNAGGYCRPFSRLQKPTYLHLRSRLRW
jgi:hypothetical protein